MGIMATTKEGGKEIKKQWGHLIPMQYREKLVERIKTVTVKEERKGITSLYQRLP